MPHPQYNFLGYSIKEIKYVNEHKNNTYVNISLSNEQYNKETKHMSFLIKITSDFAKEESFFVFQVAFLINDAKWYNEVDENTKKSEFFSIVFPFIREKIFSLTSDSNLGLFLPSLDIKSIDFEKEIMLIRGRK